MLLSQAAFLAEALAAAKTGKRMAAKIEMIAITTKSSMRVKPRMRIHYECLRWGAITIVVF
jgi:hypothetical protein